MWFKQLGFYRINPQDIPEIGALKSALNEASFKPIEGGAKNSTGFDIPENFSPELLFPAGSHWKMRLHSEDKIVPAYAVRQEVENRASALQQTEHRRISRKEKQELAENIAQEFLPRAFSKHSYIDMIFNKKSGLFLINQASDSKLDLAMQHLQDALGGITMKLPKTVKKVEDLMTQWLLAGEADGNFELNQDGELKGEGEHPATVRLSRQDLTANEITAHLQNGKTVTQLGVIWKEQIALILNENLHFKRLIFLDYLQDKAAEEGEDAASLAGATQILMSEALAEMIEELVEHLGGWSEN